jgi:hypothetical protein
MLAVDHPWARRALAGVAGVLLLGRVAFVWPEGRKLPKLVAVVGFLVGSQAAGLVAWIKALRGELNPVWEPTRR